MYKLNIRRSRRLRKKLKIAEFQELGFEYRAMLVAALDESVQEQMMDSLVKEVIEPRNLALGGWINSGFVSKFGAGSATEEDKQAVAAWLGQRSELKNIEVSALMDAWYF